MGVLPALLQFMGGEGRYVWAVMEAKSEIFEVFFADHGMGVRAAEAFRGFKGKSEVATWNNPEGFQGKGFSNLPEKRQLRSAFHVEAFLRKRLEQ